ncbi:MAG: GIY-YIG nuclease family protein [Clostridia bacterium]|nr:GIY-YIG nuclease family protein [Clostridia bacterium]
MKAVGYESFAYMVECRDHTYYCGWTNSLEHRIAQHNAGKGAKYTRSREPVRLVYFERYLTKHDAMSREWHLKQLMHKEKRQLADNACALLMAAGFPVSRKYDRPAAFGQSIPALIPDNWVPGSEFVRVNVQDGPQADVAIAWFARGNGWLLGLLESALYPVVGLRDGELYYLAPSPAAFISNPDTYIEMGMRLPGAGMPKGAEPEEKMDKQWMESLKRIRHDCAEMDMYRRAAAINSFDLETICPPKGMEELGEVNAFLDTQAFRIRQTPEFVEALRNVYPHLQELDEVDRVLIRSLNRAYLHEKHMTPEMKHEFALIYNRAYINWERAKKASDFCLFRDSLAEVLSAEQKKIAIREHEADEQDLDPYDQMLGDYERGMNSRQLDACFEACKARLIPLLRRIQASKKQIRTDFLSRPVTDEAQRRLTEYLLDTIGFDRERGMYTLTEHPFTMDAGRNNVRITTHFYPNNFTSSLYSVMHEGGHALFALLDRPEHYEGFITGERTLGMDESVSRFYENRIGRSRAFIHLIYPRVREILPDVMRDVTEEELYEAVNLCRASLIRTDADEFTYTFHIIIRYEIEKELVSGSLTVDGIPARWREKYREYLGIEPETDREGALQDVHWSSGFGYFPTYALGNIYNAMYFNRMRQELDLDGCIMAGDFGTINGWMEANVFARADLESPLKWIEDICGRPFTPDDFLDYLEEKYTKLYEL